MNTWYIIQALERKSCHEATAPSQNLIFKLGSKRFVVHKLTVESQPPEMTNEQSPARLRSTDTVDAYPAGACGWNKRVTCTTPSPWPAFLSVRSPGQQLSIIGELGLKMLILRPLPGPAKSETCLCCHKPSSGILMRAQVWERHIHEIQLASPRTQEMTDLPRDLVLAALGHLWNRLPAPPCTEDGSYWHVPASGK